MGRSVGINGHHDLDGFNCLELRRIFIADPFELHEAFIVKTRIDDYCPQLLFISVVEGWKRGILERAIEREASLERKQNTFWKRHVCQSPEGDARSAVFGEKRRQGDHLIGPSPSTTRCNGNSMKDTRNQSVTQFLRDTFVPGTNGARET